MSDAQPFFIADRELPANTASYVTRPADHELLRLVREGEYCYVLTARQMGKTSLMNRATQALRAQGYATATADLRLLEQARTIDDWYVGLLAQLTSADGLDLRHDEAAAFWRANSHITVVQRFVNVLRHVVLKEIPGRVVIFIDEIDATLRLPLRDDFFAAIRAMYNSRATTEAFGRLVFVLLGAATPSDLISERSRTPFNIGKPVELNEFSAADAMPLQQGLERQYPRASSILFERIFYWTNGHPYLTQRLCRAVVETQLQQVHPQRVDELVQRVFIGDAGRFDRNLRVVRETLAEAEPAERTAMLELYRSVRSGADVVKDETSLVHNHLELSGLVRTEKRRLRVRNPIYEQVFGPEWLAKELGPVAAAPQQPPPAANVQTASAPRRSGIGRIGLVIAGAATLLAVIAGIGVQAMQRPATPSPTIIGGGATPIPSDTIAVPSTVIPVPDATNTPSATVEPTVAEPTATEPAPPETIEPTATEPAPTDTAEPSATPEPTATPTPSPTATPEPTPTEGIVASCTVRRSDGVSVRDYPSSRNSNVVGSIGAGVPFTPIGQSEARFGFWIKAPAGVTDATQEEGWVYAGSDLDYVRCNSAATQLPVEIVSP
jgi:hypothetical protein